MKKLTAGIFATLLAVVSVDGAYAEIASKGYVDQQVGTKADAATVTSLQGTVSEHTTQIAGKADSSTVTALDGRVGTAETEIDTLQTKVDGKQDALGFTPENSANKTTTLNAQSTDAQYPSAKVVYDTIQAETSDIASTDDLSALTTRVGTLETASANHVVKNEEITGGTHTKITYDAKGLVTAGANLTADDIPTIPDTKVSGLGSLATKSSVATDDIASKAVTKAKLADDIVTSLGKADSALQQADLADYVTKEAADAAYADIATEDVASTASTNAQTALTNIGTLSQLTTDAKGNTVAAINEVANEAAAAATAAAGAKTAADTAQDDVDALETVVNNETTGLAAAHTAIDAVEGRVTTAEGEIDTIQGKISNMATSDAVSSLTTRVTTAEGDIDDLEAAVNNAESGLAATNTIADSALSTAQSAQTTANAALPKATYDSQVGEVSATNMGTTASTVVTAINEVAGEAAAAQQKANAAIPKPDGECSNPTNKCVLVSNGTNSFEWEVIARDGKGK